MNTLQQAWHILRKDLRAHWSEIASVALINLVLVATSIRTWDSINGSASSVPDSAAYGAFRWIVAILLVVSWYVLIARVIQGDSLASSRQFWLTRPYARMSLLLAKSSFIVLTVHAPTAASQLLILSASGVPFLFRDLIANQLVIATVFSLPLAVIAACTRTLGRFIFATVVLSVILAALATLELTLSSGGYPRLGPMRLEEFYWQTNWPALGIGLVSLAAISSGALVYQFRNRRSARTAVCAGAAVAIVACLLIALPIGISSRVQTLAVGEPDPMPEVGFRSASEPLAFPGYLGPDLIGINIPIAFTNVAMRRNVRTGNPIWMESESDVEFLRAEAMVRSRSGVSRKFHAHIWGGWDGPWIEFLVPTEFFERFADELVHIEFRLDVLRYSEQDIGPIPLDGRVVKLSDREQCGLGPRNYLICRAGFRGRGEWRTTLRDNTPLALLTRSSVSLPLTINPVSSYQVNQSHFYRSGVPLRATLRVPAGYARIGFAVDDLRLADWRTANDESGIGR